jgi:D-aminopeptidase
MTRARDLGLPFVGTPGPHNAITDVPGVEVGFTTLTHESPRGAVRTGVTAILPRGRAGAGVPLLAGLHSLNGNGEMTGSHWIAEAGEFAGPLLITNTHSVGICHHAAVRWMTLNHARPGKWWMPVAAETCDAVLNDMDGLHVTEAHALAAIDGAAPGPVAEGNVGGGTGMICYGFKGGTGTASRRVETLGVTAHVGVLVQANFGRRPDLSVLGVPVGRLWPPDPEAEPPRGSIIGILATDAPLLPQQLRRLAQRMGLGVARTGTPSNNGSGDLFLAFTTANAPPAGAEAAPRTASYLPHWALDPLFLATVEATEEAILNALVAARTMTGFEGHEVKAIDHATLVKLMRRHGRIA